MKQAIVYWKTLRAGILTESDEGYSFVYNKDYLSMPEARHKPNNAFARGAFSV